MEISGDDDFEFGWEEPKPVKKKKPSSADDVKATSVEASILPPIPAIVYTKMEISVSLHGESLFIDTSNNVQIIPIRVITDIISDAVGNISLFNTFHTPEEIPYNYSILCMKSDQYGMDYPDLDTCKRVIKEISTLLKKYHTNKKLNNKVPPIPNNKTIVKD